MKKTDKERKILIVDSKNEDYLKIESLLRVKNSTDKIYHSRGYKQTIRILENRNIKIDVILLNFCFIDTICDEILKHLLTSYKSIPIILISDSENIDLSKELIAKGIADFILKKSLTAEILYKSIIYCIERFKKKNELRESEKRYNELFHLSPLPMWVYDIDTLEFLDVNNAALKHYGYTKKEFFSMTLREIRPSEDYPLFDAQRVNAINHSKKFMPGIIKHLTKNKEIIYVEIQSTYLTYKGRNASVILVNDVTEKLKYVEAIENKNKELQDIAWIQSHIIRAPVAKIMGIINLINHIKLDETEMSSFLADLYTSALELDQVIHNIATKTHYARL